MSIFCVNLIVPRLNEIRSGFYWSLLDPACVNNLEILLKNDNSTQKLRCKKIPEPLRRLAPVHTAQKNVITRLAYCFNSVSFISTLVSLFTVSFFFL